MSEDETDDDQSMAVEIINKTANMCQLLDSRKTVPVIRLSFAELNSFGTMFTTCPLHKVN